MVLSSKGRPEEGKRSPAAKSHLPSWSMDRIQGVGTGRFRGVRLLGGRGSYMAHDVLVLMDSWAGVGAKNAKSSLLFSLLAMERGTEQQELLSWVLEPSFMAVCPGPGNTPSLSLSWKDRLGPQPGAILGRPTSLCTSPGFSVIQKSSLVSWMLLFLLLFVKSLRHN